MENKTLEEIIKRKSVRKQLKIEDGTLWNETDKCDESLLCDPQCVNCVLMRNRKQDVVELTIMPFFCAIYVDKYI